MNYRLSCCVLMVCLTTIALPGCSRQTAEEKGKALATEKIDLVKGVGEALKEKGGQAAESVAEGTGDVLQGAGKGFGKAFEWKVAGGPGLAKAGLAVSRIQRGSSPASGGYAVDAYLVATSDAAGTLTMIAYDSSKRELARTRVDMKVNANDGGYQTFLVDERTPFDSIREVAVDFLPRASADASKK